MITLCESLKCRGRKKPGGCEAASSALPLEERCTLRSHANNPAQASSEKWADIPSSPARREKKVEEEIHENIPLIEVSH